MSMATSLDHGSPMQRASQTVMAWLTGLLLPVYLLDESVALKVVLSPLIAASLLLLLAVSRFRQLRGQAAWQLSMLLFAIAYAVSVMVSSLNYGVTINALYPVLFTALCWRQPTGTTAFVKGLFLSLLAVVAFGWLRFVTAEGGDLAEHALGYWGIKYTLATRNSDALAPLIAACIALTALQHSSALGLRGAARALMAFSLLLTLPAIAMTFSRGAWLALVVYMLALAGLALRRLLGMAAVAGLLAVVSYAVVDLVAPDLLAEAIDLIALLERLRSIYDPSVESSNFERARLLMYALELGASHPLFGVGAARFDCCLAPFGYLDLGHALHPENLFLHMLSEFGILSAAGISLALLLASAAGLSSTSIAGRAAGAFLFAMCFWLQLNSEISSLFVWTLLAIASSVSVSAPRTRGHQSPALHAASGARP